jgi:hypothetical protein
MARHDFAVTGHRLEQSLQAAQRMLAVCGGSSAPLRPQQQPPPAGSGPLASTSRKCRSVQFGLSPRDFQRLRQVSEQLGWSRAELARRCLLLVIEFLEERYPELQSGDSTPLSGHGLDAEQLSLWPGLAGRAATPAVADQSVGGTLSAEAAEGNHA